MVNKRNGIQIKRLTTLVKWCILIHAAPLLSIYLSTVCANQNHYLLFQLMHTIIKS